MAASGLWAAVDELVDRATDLTHLRAHRVHLLAARRSRAFGEVPELQAEERLAAVAALTAPVLASRVRAALDGPLVVFKGPEVAAYYPDPALRPYRDLDVLVPDPVEAWRALVAAGFIPIGNPRLYVGIHHERPLAAPGLPLYVELHREPKWPYDLPAPPTGELLEAAVPCSLGVEGVGTLARQHHALVLAAHAWAHEPLRRLGDLVDVAAISQGLDPAELRSLATRWGLRKIWNTTQAAAYALLDGRRKSLALRLWARHLPAVRSRSVLESHLEHWLSGFWALPPRHALDMGVRAVARELKPAPGETVGAKVSRAQLAVRNALLARSEHVEQLERTGRRAPHFHELNHADEEQDGRSFSGDGPADAENRTEGEAAP